MKHKKIIEDMHRAMELSYDNSQRTYLGMSAQRTHCLRKTWLTFRHGFTPSTHYQSISHFADGHLSESITVSRLKGAGYELIADDGTGKQFEFVDGWWKGHCDGFIYIDGEKCVWEHKCTNPQKMAKLKKLIADDEPTALEKWDQNYYAQSQSYLHYSGLKRHIMTVSCHGSREIKNSKVDQTTAILETAFNYDEYLVNKSEAKDIIATDRLPEAPYTLAIKRPLCWWGEETYQHCEAYNFCTGKDIGEPDCFNCGHASFLESGVGLCNNTGHEMLPSEMAEYKPCHKYSPEFVVGYDAIEMREDGSVLYRNNAGDEIVNEDSLEFRKKIRGE